MIETIDFEVLLQLDTDKYADWALSKKAMTRDEKKKIAEQLMESKEKTFENYRYAFNEVFYKTKHWKEPTAHEKDNFPIWRKNTFERHVDFFNHTCQGNPLPIELIVDNENKRIVQSLDKFYSGPLLNLYNSWLPYSFYELAGLLGTIDFLKYLNKARVDPPTENPIELIKSELRNLFQEYENKLSDSVTKWRENKDKTSCAAFCIYLFENNYFNPNELKTAKEFAFSKYGHKFDVMINKLQLTENKVQRKGEVTKIKRLILNKRYGTV